MPEALAFAARRVISCSTFLPTVNIMSASSSITTTMFGKVSKSGIAVLSPSCICLSTSKNGSLIGSPFFIASSIFLFSPLRFLTFNSDISL